jgi:hypothetical protein
MAEKIVGEKYRRLQEIGHGAYGQIDLAEVIQPANEAEGDHESQKVFVALKKLYVNVVSALIRTKRASISRPSER